MIKTTGVIHQELIFAKGNNCAVKVTTKSRGYIYRGKILLLSETDFKLKDKITEKYIVLSIDDISSVEVIEK